MNRRTLFFASLAILSLGALSSHAAPLEADNVQRATFAIRGMVTPNCPVLLRAAVSRVDGVVEVDASLEQKKAWVRFRPGVTSPKAIIATIADKTSYQAELVGLE